MEEGPASGGRHVEGPRRKKDAKRKVPQCPCRAVASWNRKRAAVEMKRVVWVGRRRVKEGRMRWRPLKAGKMSAPVAAATSLTHLLRPWSPPPLRP